MDHVDAQAIRAAIARLAKRQHGVFSRAQAVDAGLHPDAIYRRVKAGRWEMVDYAVYRVAGIPPSWRQRLMAACLAGPAVASHRSAAALLGFVDCDEDIVEVTALRHRRRHRPDVIWHESRVLDLGVVYAVDRLEELFDDGLRRGWFSTTTVWQRWEQLGAVLRPGGRTVQAVLERKAAGARPVGSILETRFRQLLRQARLPEPVSQHEIYDANEFVARVDFAYPDFGVVIELDGEERHAGRSPRRRDARRDRHLVGLGFRVLRVYWDDVNKTPDQVACEIAALIPRSA